MFGSFQALCCASSTSFVAMAARALGPTAPSWTRLPGYFAPVSGSWLKKDLIIDGVFYVGEGWPTNCMDTCFAVKECHGFNIDRDGLCSFRSESPDEIRANAERRDDSTLFILSEVPRPVVAAPKQLSPLPPPLPLPPPPPPPSPPPPLSRPSSAPPTEPPSAAPIVLFILAVAAFIAVAATYARRDALKAAAQKLLVEASQRQQQSTPQRDDAAEEEDGVTESTSSRVLGWILSVGSIGCAAPRKSTARLSGPPPTRWNEEML